MFSKGITNSSQFLMMPISSQLLYFHFGMNADDDGFCEHFALMRMVDAKPDDLKVLQAKGFVSVFDDRVLVITDWKENNYLRSDRYTPSKYLSIYKDEIAALSAGTPVVYQMDTQVRLGQVRVGKVSKNKDSAYGADGALIVKEFEAINPAAKKFYANTTQRKACDDLIAAHGLERVLGVVSNTLPKTNKLGYLPTITTPLQLHEKWAALESGIHKLKGKQDAVKKFVVI